MATRDWGRERARRLVEDRRRQAAEEGDTLRTRAAGGCWCGQPLWHKWAGQEQGVPHPR